MLFLWGQCSIQYNSLRLHTVPMAIHLCWVRQQNNHLIHLKMIVKLVSSLHVFFIILKSLSLKENVLWKSYRRCNELLLKGAHFNSQRSALRPVFIVNSDSVSREHFWSFWNRTNPKTNMWIWENIIRWLLLLANCSLNITFQIWERRWC